MMVYTWCVWCVCHSVSKNSRETIHMASVAYLSLVLSVLSDFIHSIIGWAHWEGQMGSLGSYHVSP